MGRMFSELVKQALLLEEVKRALALKVEVLGLKLPSFELPTPVSDTKDLRNARVTGDHVIIDKRGVGILRDLAVISPTSAFSMRVERDDLEMYDGSWADFNAITLAVDSIVARQDRNDNYILALSGIKFAKHIKATITPTSPTTFTRIYATYDIIEK